MYTKNENNVSIKFPYTDNDLRKDNPNVSFPKDITDELRAEFDMLPVVPATIIEGKTQVSSTCENIDGVWTQVIEWAGPTKAELSAYLADLRWQKEEGGTVWNGWPVATDRSSQQKVLAEFVAVSGGLRTENAPWKFADGTFSTVSNADFPSLDMAVRGHVEACFGVEAAIIGQINAGQITTYAEIDSAAWPS